VRVVDVESRPNVSDNNGKHDGTLYRTVSGGVWNDRRARIVRGFEPSCPHDDGSASGVVLDPFAGAGTTGMVALQHGREFVGIELNPEYAQMARERIETAVRLGFRAPQNGSEQIAGQTSIFDMEAP
jgi:hypothetical protein